MVIMVDPPGGWRYGFPKILDETITFRKFLLNNGYPRCDLEMAEKYSRYWSSNDEGNEQPGPQGQTSAAAEEPCG